MARDRRDVLPLAFHVTYWDRPWSARFEPSATGTDRRFAVIVEAPGGKIVGASRL
jgi:hypothetical protein